MSDGKGERNGRSMVCNTATGVYGILGRIVKQSHGLG